MKKLHYLLICGASGVTVLASCLSVILIMHSVVVPHLQQQAHIGSLCTITDILTTNHSHPAATNTHTHSTWTLSHSNLQADLNTRVSDQRTGDAAQLVYRHQHGSREVMGCDGGVCSECVMVRVLYYDLDDQLRSGYLLHRRSLGHGMCFCVNCKPRVTPGIKTLLHDSMNLTQGHTVSCYYKTKPYSSEATPISSEATPTSGQSKLPATWQTEAHSSRVTFHAILWPTLCFVAGFVGLVFISIYLYGSSQVVVRNVQFRISVSGKKPAVI